MPSTAIRQIDEFNYHHTISDTAGVSLVFYTGPHCGACHHLRNVLNEYLKRDNHLTVFEVDAVNSSALVNEFNVFHLPSMFLYNDGRYHCELHAEALPDKIKQAIKLALLKPAEEEP